MSLSIDEAALLIAGSDPAFWQQAKKHTPEKTYKRKRSLFLKLQREQQREPENSLPYTAELTHQVQAALPD